MNSKLFKRVLRSGVTLFKRSGMLGVSSILVTVVTLTVVLGLFFTQALLDATIHTIESRVDVTIYIADNIPSDTISEMQRQIEAMPEVKDVKYISKDEALELFKERHISDELTLQAIDEIGKNPLRASFVIHAKDTAQYESIITSLEEDSTFIEQNKSNIASVNFNRNREIIDKVLLLRDGVQRFGITLTLIFVIIAILVTFNTVKISTFTMKDEIEVMRLVGAKSSYIRGPFIVAQIIYSIIAAIITLLIFLGVTYLLRNSLTIFFGVDLFSYYLNNIIQISLLVLGSGIILGTISSVASVNRYLNK